MAPASRLTPGGGMRLSVTAPAHPDGGTPATGTPAVDAPAAGPGTGACPIFIARTSGRLVAWRICQTPVSFSAHAPNIIAQRPGRAPGEATRRRQPRQLLVLGMKDNAMQYRVRRGGPWQTLLP